MAEQRSRRPEPGIAAFRLRLGLAAIAAGAVVLAAAVAMVAPARSQDAYPSRPITMIVPFAAGGSTDVIGRVIAEGLRGPLGQPVVVENRAGAGGTLGTAAIAKAAPDGYTIGIGTASTLAINPAAYRSLPFDVTKDLAPVTAIAAVPNIMTINPAVPAATMAEFISLARAAPGRFAYGSSGNGSVAHLMGEQFRLATGLDIVHVPYRGLGPALNDAVAGQIQVLFDNLPTSLPLATAGRLRPLAVSSPQRLTVLPQVPSFAELGLGDLDWMAFFGVVAPAGTPDAVVNRLAAATRQALAQGNVRRTLAEQQAVIIGNSPQEFARDVARELARFRRAVAAAGITVD